MNDQPKNWVTIYQLRRGKSPLKLGEMWLANITHPQDAERLSRWLAEGKSLKLVARHEPEPSRFD